jgi:hypothetical protein
MVKFSGFKIGHTRGLEVQTSKQVSLTVLGVSKDI